MSDLPLSKNPPDDDSSWENLAEDLFGIDLTKKNTSDADAISDDEFDALTGGDLADEFDEPQPAAAEGDTFSAEPSFAGDEPSEPRMSDGEADFDDEAGFEDEEEDLLLPGEDWGDEAEEADEPATPPAILNERAQDDVAQDDVDRAEEDVPSEEPPAAPAEGKDSYWEALDQWDWNEESAPRAPSQEGGRRPQHRDSGRGRSGSSGRGRGGDRDADRGGRPKRSSGGGQGRGGETRGESRRDRGPRSDERGAPRSSRPAPSESSAPPPPPPPTERPSRKHEEIDDFDFGEGLLANDIEAIEEQSAYDAEQEFRDQAARVHRVEEVEEIEDGEEIEEAEEVAEGPAGEEEADTDEEAAPRKRRRRRRRRRRGRPEKRDEDRAESDADEGLESGEEPEEEAAASFDEEVGFPEDDAVESPPPRKSEPVREPRAPRRPERKEAPRRAAASSADDDDLADDDLLEDEALEAGDIADDEDEDDDSSQSGYRSHDDVVPTLYSNIPTWEEAISYLVKSGSREDRGRESDAPGGRKPDGPRPRQQGRRGGRRKH